MNKNFIDITGATKDEINQVIDISKISYLGRGVEYDLYFSKVYIIEMIIDGCVKNISFMEQKDRDKMFYSIRNQVKNLDNK